MRGPRGQVKPRHPWLGRVENDDHFSIGQRGTGASRLPKTCTLLKHQIYALPLGIVSIGDITLLF